MEDGRLMENFNILDVERLDLIDSCAVQVLGILRRSWYSNGLSPSMR
jgi:anti-anti-sigma regulatory factor